jgi:DNA-binding MarR family transcriptional regulator
MQVRRIPRSDSSRDVKDVLDSIRRIMRSLRVASRASEKEVGLSSAQLEVIVILSSADSMSLNELAEKTHTHQSSASVVVSRLVERKLVRRIRSKNDARKVVLTLAPAAQRILNKAPAGSKHRVEAALESMKPAERRQLAALLRKLVSTAGLEKDEIIPIFAEVPKVV